MSVVLSQPEFNGNNTTWTFYLVGTDYNDYIEGELESHKAHGEPYLVHTRGNYKIYVMKWSEVLTDFELRHEFIQERLKMQREKLASKAETADDVLANGYLNPAAMPPAVGPLITSDAI